MATKTTKKATKTTRTPRAPRIKPEPQAQRPFLRPGTWIVLAAAAIIGAALFIFNRQAEQKAAATPTPGPEEVFIFEGDKVVNSIEVVPAEGNAVRVERNGENVWMLSKPEEADADQGAAEAAASQLGALLVVIPIENVEDPAVFGFDEPAYIVTVEFEDGAKGVLEVGDLTPSGDGYYVRLDNKSVYVVAASGIDALTSLTYFPPYLNTPTPSPTATLTPLPTETPVPAIETSSTPEATATP